MSVRVVASVIEREGRLLVCERPRHKRHGGLWEFPGGKVEPGESDFEAVERELGEELGVQVREVGPVLFSTTDPGSPFVIEFLPVGVEGEPRCLEHAALAWVTEEELLSLPLAPGDLEFARFRLGRAAERTGAFLLNAHPDHGRRLRTEDAAVVGLEAAEEAERYFVQRPEHAPTPLYALPDLARELGIGSIHLKDEGQRHGLGSFKALGGSYAVVRLVLEEARRRLGRPVEASEAGTPEVRAVAAGLTFGCATDGNHGRAVAAGARMVGARAVVFMHEGVSPERVAAIERYGAKVIRVPGTYDDSVLEASRRCAEEGWTVLSDTSWPGYERVPGLVMQGYTVLLRETLRALSEPPTHVFVQAGVGGIAATVAGFLAQALEEHRPRVIVVEPARAACLLESARAGRPVQIAAGEPTVMAMLECYAPSLVAWRILSRAADAFLAVEEEDAVGAMRRLARPAGEDPAIVAGESGGVGVAGLLRAARDGTIRAALGLGERSRALVINTEGATDPERYRELVGAPPG